MNLKMKRSLKLLSAIVGVLLVTPTHLPAQSFTNYPVGDDVTPSLGQFQIVMDSVWRKTFDFILEGTPLGDTLVTKHIRLYKNGVFTSPTLYDPTTKIGRSDSFISGGSEETNGLLAGAFPGRTYITDSQLVVRPTWSVATNGARAIHTFLKSMHLTDSFTTHVGFSVKAGVMAPTRPVCAGEVEGGTPEQDFPARSFFNVYVVVDLPSGGLLPPIQLVNVEPLLVQQTNLTSFPPRLVYIHENSTAVPMYFNNDCIIHDPSSGDIPVARGTLFGQLTLAGHGVKFSSTEIESFQTEFENEEQTNSMALRASPLTNIVIQDFAPDYNAGPLTLAICASSFTPDGAFVFTINNLPANSTNYLQATSDFASGKWETVATLLPSTNGANYADQSAITNRQRYYRLMGTP